MVTRRAMNLLLFHKKNRFKKRFFCSVKRSYFLILVIFSFRVSYITGVAMNKEE